MKLDKIFNSRSVRATLALALGAKILSVYSYQEDKPCVPYDGSVVSAANSEGSVGPAQFNQGPNAENCIGYNQPHG